MRPTQHMNPVRFLQRLEANLNHPKYGKLFGEAIVTRLKSYTYETHNDFLVKIAKSVLAGHSIPWKEAKEHWKALKNVPNSKREKLIAEKRARHPSRCV